MSVDDIVLLDRLLDDIDKKVLKDKVNKAVMEKNPKARILNFPVNLEEINLLRRLIIDEMDRLSK